MQGILFLFSLFFARIEVGCMHQLLPSSYDPGGVVEEDNNKK